MIRYECLQLLASKISNQLVVTSQSGQRIEWSHLSRHEGGLLVGMMGCAIGVATGLALALPHRKVIAIDSDGNIHVVDHLNAASLNEFIQSFKSLAEGSCLHRRMGPTRADRGNRR